MWCRDFCGLEMLADDPQIFGVDIVYIHHRVIFGRIHVQDIVDTTLRRFAAR